MRGGCNYMISSIYSRCNIIKQAVCLDTLIISFYHINMKRFILNLLKAIINKIDPNFLRSKIIIRPSYLFQKQWAEVMFKITGHWHIDIDLDARWWINLTEEEGKMLDELADKLWEPISINTTF